MNSLRAAISVVLLALLATPAARADAPTEADLAALRAQIEALQAQLDAQRAQLEKLEQGRLAAQDAPKVSMNNGRPTIAAADGASTLSLRALVQGDAGHYVQDPTEPLAVDFRRGSVGSTNNRENNSARDLSDGMEFRRARMGFEGIINRNFGYKLVLELGGSGTEGPTRINDAWVSYTGFAPFAIQVGAGPPPANMDDGTSADELPFIERSTVAELSRSLGGGDGRTGVIVRGNGKRWFASTAFTGRTAGDAETFDTQRAVVARLAALAATGADYNVHVGASGTLVLRPADGGLDTTGSPRYGIRLRTQPELRVDSTRLVDTGAIDADGVRVTGLELAGNWRNFMLQGENFWFDVERRDGTLPDPEFGGWYVQGRWVITGESHRYNMANASYQNPRPAVNVGSQGGLGAWELALRYSHMDLDFRDGVEGLAIPVGGIRGGEQDIWTFGLNWYLNPNLRLVFDYLRIDVDRLNPSPTAFGPAPQSPPVGVAIGQDLDAYALRTQFSF